MEIVFTTVIVSLLFIITAMKIRTKFYFRLVGGLCILVFSFQNVNAQDSTSWINPSGGDWDNASNWSNGVPTITTDAIINLSGTYTVTINNLVHINNLQLGTTGSGTQTLNINSHLMLQNGGTIESSGAIVWAAGTLQGTDTLVNNGTLTVQGTVSKNLELALDNLGTVIINGTTTFSGGSLINESNGEVKLLSGASIENDNGGPFVNHGLLLKTGGTGTATILTNFINYDSILVDSGNLLFASTNTVTLHGGSYNVMQGDSLQFTDNKMLVSGNLTGNPSGAIIFECKNSYADSTAANLNFGGTGVIWTYGHFSQTGNGSWSNQGKFYILGQELKYISGVNFYNHGSIEITGNPTLNGGSLINESGGTIKLLDGASVENGNGGPFVNHGLLLKTGGTGTATILTNFINYDSVLVDSGNLLFASTNTVTLHGGSYNVMQGDSLQFTDNKMLVSGNLTGNPSGAIIFECKNSYADSTAANLNFGGTGVIWTYGHFSQTGNGSWSNQGKFYILGQELKYISGVNFYNHGSIEITGNPTLNGGSLINESDGTVTMLDSALLDNYNGQPFTNYGHLIINGGTNTIRINCPFVNYNEVSVNSGNLYLKGTISLHGGIYDVPKGDTLFFAADHLNAEGNLTGNLPGTIIFENGEYYADSADAALNFSNADVYWTGGIFSRLGFGTWINDGTLNMTGLNQKSMAGGGFQFLNHGVININSGFILNSIVYFINESDGIIYLNNNASITGNGPNPGPFYNYGLLEKTGNGQASISPIFLNEAGGSITGIGALRFYNLKRNWGRISPGNPAGQLTWVGNLKMDSAACELDEDIAGVPTGNNYDQLVVNGNVTLKGNLRVNLLNGYVPQGGDVYTLMKANYISGSFDSMSGIIADSMALYPDISNTSITLTAVKGIPGLRGPITANPNSAKSGNIQDVTIKGGSFPPDVSVYLQCDQCDYPANSFKVPGKILKISQDSIFVQFDFSDQFISGQYDIVVKDPRGESVKTLFNVNTVSEQNLIVSVYPVWPWAKENPTQSGVVAFTLNRPTSNGVIVNYQLSGTAQEFTDYVINIKGSIKFPAGEQERDLIITPLKDNVADDGETVKVKLMPSPTSSYQINTGEEEGTVTIQNGPPPGTFALFNSTPDSAGNDGTITITINGQGFFPNSSAVLQGPKTLNPISLLVDTLGNFIQATFNVTGLNPGDKFDLAVNNGRGKTGTIPDALTIDKFRRPNIYISLSGASSFESWLPPQKYYVSVSNWGNVDAYMVPVFITVSEANSFGLLKPDFKIVNVDPTQFDSSFTGFPGWGNKSAIEYDRKTNKWLLSIIIPEVRANTQNTPITLGFYARGHIIDAWTTPTGQPLLTTNEITSINTSMNTAQGKNRVHVWTYIPVPYKVTTSGLQFLNCISALFNLGLHAVDLAGAEKCISSAIWYAMRTGLGFATPSGPSSTGSAVYSTFSVVTGLNGVIVDCIEGAAESIPWIDYLSIPMDVMDALDACKPIIADIYKHTIHSDEFYSRDPNYIVGPSGNGDLHYTKGIGIAGYIIHFENDSSATAPAKFVNVTDQLDPDKFDLSTFSLGPISFGDTTVTPPPGLKNWITTVGIPNENKYVVRIIAGLNEATDIVNWQIMAIDTATGEYPTDPSVGFLPPDVNPPEGEGSVFFTIRPNGSQSSGTQLDNQASIIFDANAPIYTKKWSNVLDFEAPVSHMNSLAPVQSDSTFKISWEGYDATSGIAGYNIYVSINHGPFSLWTSTSDTTALYSGSPDSVYGFYSIATDYAGNIEQKPDTAEVSTSPIITSAYDRQIPKKYALLQNYPNPFNPSTTIRFELPKAGITTLSIYNILGQRVYTVTDKYLRAGRYSFRINASRWASGVYFYRIRSGNFMEVKKMILIK